jgi:SPP1 family predicted phage head-tail adaptor
MRFRIVLQVPTNAKGTSGQDVHSYADWKTRWAGIDPMKGTELFTAQQTEASSEIVFKIRYLTGVTPKHRIRWDSRSFDIKSIVNIANRNRELLLYARERL